MQDATQLIHAVADLLWPLVAACFLWMFRAEIRGLFSRIRRGKLPGVEIELDPELDRLDRLATAAEIATSDAGPPVRGEGGSNELREVLAEAARSPKVALMMLAAAIERELRNILTAKVDPKYLDEPGRPWREALQRLDLDPTVKSAVEEFRTVHHRVIHGPGVSDDEVLRAIDAGIKIYNALHGYPRRHWSVVHPRVELYEDGALMRMREDWHGVVLETEAGDGQRIRSVVGSQQTHFERGKSVEWEWNAAKRVGQSWYRDPDTHQIIQAFASSPEFIGRHVDER